MVLYIQHSDGTRDFYVVNETKDLRPIFEHFESAASITLMSHGLRDALDNIARHLSKHHMTAWVEADDIAKGLKDLAVGLGLTAAAAAGLSGPTSGQMRAPTSQVQRMDNFGSAPEDKFLWNIMQLESRGGKNLSHKAPAQGEPVIGRWGIKKPTINEMIDRAGANLPAHLQPLRRMDRLQAEAHFKQNPQSELDIARMIARHVMKRQRGDVDKAAYAWLHGHNLQRHDIPSSALVNSEYVRKFRSLHRHNPYARLNVQKAETKDFKVRLDEWITERRESDQEIPRDHSFNPDPGRKRDDQELLTDNDKWKMKMKGLRALARIREGQGTEEDKLAVKLMQDLEKE
jgi:hypothetical protein